MIKTGASTILAATLFLTAMRLPTPTCAIASAEIGKPCRLGCCANKACCAQSQKNHSLPAQPLAKDSGVKQEIAAVVSLSLTIPPIPVCRYEVPTPSATSVADATPRQALLCIFLI